jgi:hypothetical protein
MKSAIILHGPPCVGKSTIAKRLLNLIPSSLVSLDDGWQEGGARVLGGHGRYADLKEHPAKVLIIEIALGEPLDMSPGATRQANEWVGLLRADGRRVFPFLLWMDWEDANARMLERQRLEPANIFRFGWWTATYAWYEHRHYLTTFPPIPDFAEERIMMANRTPDQVAIQIMQRVQIAGQGVAVQPLNGQE